MTPFHEWFKKIMAPRTVSFAMFVSSFFSRAKARTLGTSLSRKMSGFQLMLQPVGSCGLRRFAVLVAWFGRLVDSIIEDLDLGKVMAL